ncbi:MAG: hypothetical protein QF464_21640, partial [Myxococcota bacterium]|nr:hypothetical protein [Myxococcota bacterium]
INGFEPATIALHGDDHAVHVHLPALRSAWDAIKDGFTDDGEDPPLDFTTAEGLVSVAIDFTAAGPIDVHVAATTAITVDGMIDGETVSLNLPASQGSVSLDQSGGLMDASVAVGALLASVAGELITKIIGDGCDDDDEEPDPVGPTEPCVPNELVGLFALDLPGLSLGAQMVDAAENIAVNNLMVGDTTTTVSLDGETVMTFDLNAALDRMVNLTVGLCGDTPQITVDPALTVSAMFAMAPVSATFPDLEGSWIEDDTLGIQFDGTTPTLSLDPLQVVSGTLVVTSASRPDLNHTITAGQCFQLSEPDDDEPTDPGADPLPPEEEEEEDEHLFSEMAVTTCETD